jgi:alginate O-acetyltransferase complex protein AlgI
LISRTIPPDVFTTPAKFGGLELAGYLIAYSFVIYNDFAGYTSIARGISCLFGIDLAPNFQRPYFASTFTEFWNRWHMSFSFWLRDYIYFPLSRALAKLIPNRKHPIHIVVPPLVTMLLSGLWHAASPNMLLWGGLHGIFLMIRQIPLPGRKPVPPPQQPIWYRTTGAVLTFFAVTLAWVPFRMDLSTALEYYRSMFLHPLMGVLPVGSLLLIIPPLLFDWLEAAQGEDAPLRWPQLARSSALALVILLIMLMFLQVADVTTFVYQEF